MSDDGTHHLGQPDDVPDVPDVPDPLRDPIHADETDPDPFDAATHGPSGATTGDDWDQADEEWTLDDDLPSGVMDDGGSPDSADLDRAGLDSADLDSADLDSAAGGPPADSDDDRRVGGGSDDAESEDLDDPWYDADDHDGTDDADAGSDALDGADPAAPDHDGPEHAEVGLDSIAAAVADALVGLDGPSDVGSAPLSLGGWADGGVIVEPADSAWAVPVVDPDPGFIDVDLLG